MTIKNCVFKTVAVAVIITMLTISVSPGCLTDGNDENSKTDGNSLIGTWIYEGEGETGWMTFKNDGSLSFKPPGTEVTIDGSYELNDGNFTFNAPGDITATYQYVIEDNALRLTYPSGETQTFYRE